MFNGAFGLLIGVLKDRTDPSRRTRWKKELESDRLSSLSESNALLNELSAGTLGALLCSERGGEDEGKKQDGSARMGAVNGPRSSAILNFVQPDLLFNGEGVDGRSRSSSISSQTGKISATPRRTRVRVIFPIVGSEQEIGNVFVLGFAIIGTATGFVFAGGVWLRFCCLAAGEAVVEIWLGTETRFRRFAARRPEGALRAIASAPVVGAVVEMVELKGLDTTIGEDSSDEVVCSEVRGEGDDWRALPPCPGREFDVRLPFSPSQLTKKFRRNRIFNFN